MNTPEFDSAARKRYKNRGLYPEPRNDKELFLNDFAHRLNPSLGFYVLSIIAGICCGLALLLHSWALIILTIALLPFCGPFLGIALSCVTGSLRFFWQSFSKYLLSVLLFICGAFATGFFGQSEAEPRADMLEFFTTFDLYSLISVAVCAFVCVLFLSKSLQQMPQALSSGMMAFIMIPLGITAYCLSSKTLSIVPACFGAWFGYGFVAILSAISALLIMRAGRMKATAIIMSGVIYILAITMLLNTLGFIRPTIEERLKPSKNYALHAISLATYTPTMTYTFTSTLTPSPTSTFTSTPTITPSLTPSNTATLTTTPVPPTATPTNTSTVTPSQTATRTLIPSRTPTKTIIASPSAIFGIVYVKDDIGLLVRKNPSFQADVIKSQYNSSILELLDETVESDGVTWVKVRTNEGYIGWASMAALRTATPHP